MEFLDEVPGVGLDSGDVAGGDGGAAVADPEVETSEVPEGEAPPEGEQPETPPQDEPKPDGRTAADAVKKAIARIRESDPKLADLVRKEYFKRDGEVRQFREAFATPADAQAAKELLETEGGAEAIARNKEEADAYAAELRAMSEGRPEVIDSLVQDFPEALPKLADYGLQKLQQVNPEAYARTASRIIAGTLRDRGFTSTLQDLARVIGEGGEGAQRIALDLATKLSKWVEGTEQLAQRSAQPVRPEDDPREKELSEREQRLNEETERVKHEQIGRASLTRMNSVIQGAMVPYLKGKNLTEAQKAGVYRDAFENISESLKGNEDYQSKLRSLIKRGNIQDIAKFVESHTRQKVGAAVKAAWESRGFSGGAARRTAPAATTTGIAMNVSKKPDASEIDWTKDPGRSRYMGAKDGGNTGEATLKNGKIVRWSWQAQ